MIQKHCKNIYCYASLHPTCSQKWSDSRKVSGFGFLWSVRWGHPNPCGASDPSMWVPCHLPLACWLPWSTIKRRPFHCSFSLLLFPLPKKCHFASLSLFSVFFCSQFDSICFREITQQMPYTRIFIVVLFIITPALSIFFGKVVTFNIL